MRQCDPSFGVDEKLWRRIDDGAVAAGGRVKPSALRLQVSVVREKHGKMTDAPLGKFNGVAEVTAGDASSVKQNGSRFVCVDEPVKDCESHALIALVVEPGSNCEREEQNELRQALARKMTIAMSPKK